jgi:hypothetical protein
LIVCSTHLQFENELPEMSTGTMSKVIIDFFS